jgi:hypothetical protein
MKRGMWIGKIVVMVIVFGGLFIYLTMLLWNWLVPDLFNGPVLNYWQTLGLIVLSKIIFSGFGKGGGHKPGPWRGYWKEKWQGMNPEERERFKQKMKEKWCYTVPDTSDKDSGISNG